LDHPCRARKAAHRHPSIKALQPFVSRALERPRINEHDEDVAVDETDLHQQSVKKRRISPEPTHSRFYIKKRILVTSASKYIPPECRAQGKERCTHKWMLCVTNPTQDADDISAFVEKVRVFLHPSYRPHDVCDIPGPAPFQLLRYGWGDFPLRLQVFFHDKRNPPVDVIHLLRLDSSHSGRQEQGTVQTVELDLDRRTQMNVQELVERQDVIAYSSTVPTTQENLSEWCKLSIRPLALDTFQSADNDVYNMLTLVRIPVL
jgi:transcription initiation factor IIF auxiliary subunit